MLEEVIKENEELIKKETLAEEIKYGETGREYIEISINGEKLQVEVEKVD